MQGWGERDKRGGEGGERSATLRCQNIAMRVRTYAAVNHVGAPWIWRAVTVDATATAAAPSAAHTTDCSFTVGSSKVGSSYIDV